MKLDMEVLKKHENKHTKFVFRNDNIVEVYCANDFEYDVKEVEENILVLKKHSSLHKLKILNIVAEGTSITKAAREFLAKAPHKQFASVEAFFISSVVQQLTANFYLKINKPKRPTRFFVKFEDAEKWLTGIKDEYV